MWVTLLHLAIQAPAAPNDPQISITRDTARALKEARTAVIDFEQRRRHYLPITSGRSGRCDDHIGRFCYWYDESDSTRPKEPEPLVRHRRQLLGALTRFAFAAPTDDWVIGQRVRYLLEAEESDSAIALASDCRATQWWCEALLGLALHARQRFEASEAAFDRSLAHQPASLRCSWTDWAKVLPEQVARRLKDRDCAGTTGLADSLFWLGQPLLSRPGNDLRTELYSRRVMAALHAASLSPHLIPWGHDLEEMMLRYGWPTGWSVADQPPGGLNLPSVVGHDRVPAYPFFPIPGASDGGWRWELGLERPRARYAPGYADRFATASDFQLAKFPRGDSTVLVGAMSPPGDTEFSEGPFRIALAASRQLGERATTAFVGASSVSEPVILRVAGNPALISLEANPVNGRAFLRARTWRPPAPRRDGLIISDLLLFAVAPDLPGTLEAAAARALPSLRISRQAPVGVYWEASGPGSDSVEVVVTVTPVRRGLFGRIGQRLSIVSRRKAQSLTWQAATDSGQVVVGRAFELNLRRQSPGRYLLGLEARSRGKRSLTTRSFQLTP